MKPANPHFIPRPAQQRVLAYRRGRLGISAVPGSGKTQTLSYLAAQLVRDLAGTDSPLAGAPGWSVLDTQEVLIVTFSNSAVENFRRRIGHILEHEFGLLPNAGYRVRTLHALANDIVRMRPALVGLADDFQIADERAAALVLDEAVAHQVALAPDALDPLLSAELDERKAAWVRRDRWPDLARQVARAVIRRAKDLELTPADLHARLGPLDSADDALLKLGRDVYETYQRGLQMRNTVDFDDLIRLALQALRLAPDFLARLRHRWPYILEDEAQDSSELQEKMLRLLTDTSPESTLAPGPPAEAVLTNDGNWVRVGDPNQAINTTFTTADPKFLRKFLHEPGAGRFDLPDSGRSAIPIIDLANYLVEWTASAHPVPWLRENAFLRQAIVPTTPGDPQPNPDTSFVYLDERSHSPDDELRVVADSLQRWLPEHPDWTVAVLVPENNRGFQLAEILKSRDIPYEELLRSSAATRAVAGKLELVVRFLAQPDQRSLLADVYKDVWWPRKARDAETAPSGRSTEALTAALSAALAEPLPGYRTAPEAAGRRGPLPLSPLDETLAKQVERELRRVPNVEDLLYPTAAADWLADLKPALDHPALRVDLDNFRTAVRRWLEGSMLPIDQLLLTLGNELFTEATDLALTHKLAVVLAAFATGNPLARLAELADELALIARNERRFLGFDTANVGYEPSRGMVTIATMHAAKGLEWDRVYLMALNNYSFPGAQSFDSYLSEPWFVRDHLNPEAETLARLEAYLDGDTDWFMPGEASAQARLGYAAERLRLFYVGITRARRDVIVTWNFGRFGAQDSARRNQPAIPFLALHEFWKARLKDLNQP